MHGYSQVLRTNQSLCASNKRKSCVGVFVQTSPSIPDYTISLWFLHLFWALFVISYSNQDMDAFIVQSKQVNHAHTSNLPPTHYHLSRNTINISLKTCSHRIFFKAQVNHGHTVSLNFVESVYLQCVSTGFTRVALWRWLTKAIIFH